MDGRTWPALLATTLLVGASPALANEPAPAAATPASQIAATGTASQDYVGREEFEWVQKVLQAQQRKLAEQEEYLQQYSDMVKIQQEQLDSYVAQMKRLSAAVTPGSQTWPQEQPRFFRAVYKETPPPDGQQIAQVTGEVEKPLPEITIIRDKGGALLPQGQMVIEPSFSFTFSQVNRVEIAGFSLLPAILIGQFELTESRRNTFTVANTVRLGVTNDFEVELRVPYVFRDDEITSRPFGTGSAQDTTRALSDSNLGDIEFAGHYQINRGLNDWPIFIGNFRFKTRTGEDPFEVARDQNGQELELPTGSGFYSLQPSITAILPTDPAVLFANLSYTFNLERDVGGTFGDVDSGDVFGANFGAGIALNERTSISLGYEHSVVGKTEQNGSDVPGSDTLQVGSFLFGGSFRLNDRVSFNVTTSLGATEDAPDTEILVRIPISLSVF